MYPQEIDDAGEFWSGYAHTPSAPLSPVTGLSLLNDTPRKAGVISASTPSITISSNHSSSGSSPSLPETPIDSYTRSGYSTPAEGRVGDDSYWALYSSVGGTADSTHPSPRLPDGKKQILDEYGRPILADGLEEEGKGGQGYVEYEPLSWQVGEAPDRFELEEYRKETELDIMDAPPEVKEIEDRLSAFGVDPLLSPSDGKTPMVTASRLASPKATLAMVFQGAYSTWLAQHPGGSIDDFLAIVRSAVLP